MELSNTQGNGNNHKCSKCNENFVYFPNEVFWDEHGFGYSTKLTHCPYCGQLNILKYYEDRAMNKLNYNDWEYETATSLRRKKNTSREV